MKSQYYFFLSIFLVFFSLIGHQKASAQECEIGEIQIEILPCNESGYFKVEIDFDYSEVGDEGFRIQGNGHDYGDFEYAALPIILNGLEGDGTTEYEFVIIDNQFENCTNWGGIEPIDCGGNGDCFIGELSIDDYPCEEGSFNIYLNFEYENVGEEGFKFFVNQDLFGEYNYADLPLNIGPFEGDGETVYHFLVADAVHDGCASDKNFGPINCEGGDCHIWDLVLDDLTCEDGLFEVYLDFNYDNVSDEGFKVVVNEDVIGEYAYSDLPLNVGPFEGDGETIYHFLVRDLAFEGCAEDGNLGPVNCEGGDCHIWDVEADVQECNEEGFFNVLLNFNYTNTGNEGFKVQGNGNNYGNFEYSDLPVTIGPLEGDGETEYEFVVKDNQFGDCSDWTAIDPIDCGGNEDCFIGELIIDDHPCENGQYNVYLNFEYENVSEEGFKLFINWDLYESYSYDDLPLNVGTFEGDGETEYHFLVRDKQFEDCASDEWFGPIECESEYDCNIWDMEATALPCNDDNQFDVLINFLYDNEGGDGFTIKGNGNNYGSFSYSDLPIELGPFEADGIFEYEFEARDNHYENCFDYTGVEPFLCDTTFQMMNTSIEVVDCNEDKYFLNIDFDYINQPSNRFLLTGNWNTYEYYNYSDLPVIAGPFTNDEISSYYYVIRDSESLNHGDWKRFYAFDCESLGIENTELDQFFKIYPNPASTTIYFENNSTDDARVFIFHANGTLIKELPIFENSKTGISNLNAGLYFYRIITKEGVTSGKFVVR